MQSNATLVFSVDVHVVTSPAAPLRLLRLPRVSRLSQQLCWAALRRLTFYACARFLSSSAVWFRGHVSGLVRGSSPDPRRVRRDHSLQPYGGEFSADAGGAFCSRRPAAVAC